VTWRRRRGDALPGERGGTRLALPEEGERVLRVEKLGCATASKRFESSTRRPFHRGGWRSPCGGRPRPGHSVLEVARGKNQGVEQARERRSAARVPAAWEVSHPARAESAPSG